MVWWLLSHPWETASVPLVSVKPAGEGRNRVPSCSSGSRPLPVQPSGRWDLGTDQTVRTSTASTPSGARPTAVTCCRCPREPKFSYGHHQDQRHQGGEWGLPAQRVLAMQSQVSLCTGLNANAADSCSHTQTLHPCPGCQLISSSPRVSQGPASSYKNPQDQRGTHFPKRSYSKPSLWHSATWRPPKIIES